MMKDLGRTLPGKGYIYADASAALGIIQRRGVGSIRHLDTRLLWVQDKAVKEVVDYKKVAGAINPADLGTKHLDKESIARHLKSWDLEEREGRPKVAPGETEWGEKGDDDELGKPCSRSPKTGLHSLSVVRGGTFGPWGG